VSVPEAFAYPLPAALDPLQAAPLLCAGIIGYRAYARSGVRPGGRLGLYGFGGSAHIVIQIARHHGCEVFVVTRGGVHRELAENLGAAWVGEARERPPAPLDAAILFAPAGELVPVALAALDRGGRLAVAGIHLSQIPPLDYQAHLFEERTLCSVTANTRADGEALLALAAEIPIRTHTHRYPLEAANQALLDLKQDRVRGSAVLEIGRPG
jgi:propanol-preferring alcohol dehydrogenase